MKDKFGTIIEVALSGNQYQVVPPCNGQEFALKPLDQSKPIINTYSVNSNMNYEPKGYTKRFDDETVNSGYWKEVDFKDL